MTLGIGIDTGGTYTDGVIFDFDTNEVLAKGKALTTKEDLSEGIGNALDLMPRDLLEQGQIISISTTLATNACVENKGSRAKLILAGTTRKILDWIDVKSTYGINPEDVLCVDAVTTYDGKITSEPDWEIVVEKNREWFSSARALCIAEVFAPRNGAAIERKAKEVITRHYNVPFVMANELSGGANVMERGATALLNARLLPVIEEFTKAVEIALKSRNLDIETMIVRSDGSLMTMEISKSRPVETILSGPAASIVGGRILGRSDNSIIIDMGGTTTDISVLEDDIPVMVDSIRIGKWRTQIKGVFIDTFGLGGDSRIFKSGNLISISSRRVVPLCIAAVKWPQIIDSLENLESLKKMHSFPLYEFLYLVRVPDMTEDYTSHEKMIIQTLGNGPVMLGDCVFDIYNLKSERLEDEGIVMRCGLTPTDIMHIKGDFNVFDTRASVLGAKCFLNSIDRYMDSDNPVMEFSNEVYETVSKKLYSHIVRILMERQFQDSVDFKYDDNVEFIIEQSWNKRNLPAGRQMLGLNFETKAKLVGIGAPTHIFLAEVAKALGTGCVLPEHAEVANAVGAVVADIRSESVIEIKQETGVDEKTVHVLHSDQIYEYYASYEDAVDRAKTLTEKFALDKARHMGALGELMVKTEIRQNIAPAKGGLEIDLGTFVTSVVSGKIDYQAK